jgi:hypothetical protein
MSLKIPRRIGFITVERCSANRQLVFAAAGDGRFASFVLHRVAARLAEPTFRAYAPLVASEETDETQAKPGTDDVCGAARAADDLDEDGDAADAEELAADEELEPVDPPPERVTELAGACVRFVAARYGVTLDYAPDTLSFIDQWVRDTRGELARRPEVADVAQAAAGAYLGEVVRRAFGGSWVVSEDMTAWRVCLSRVYCAFNPVGMVREALLLDRAEGWQAHFELDPGERDAIEQRLEALPPVEDDEFFAPSTRFDVVSIVFDALRASMETQGLADVRFSSEDYI